MFVASSETELLMLMRPLLQLALSLLLLAPFSSFSFVFLPVLRQDANHSPFAQLSLTVSLLHHCTTRFSFKSRLDKSSSFYLTRLNVLKFTLQSTYSSIKCMFQAARQHASLVFILGSLVNKRGDDLILSLGRVYLLWIPSFAKRSTTAVATSKDNGSSAASAARPKPVSLFR